MSQYRQDQEIDIKKGRYIHEESKRVYGKRHPDAQSGFDAGDCWMES